MAEGNGQLNGQSGQERAEVLALATSVLLDRLQAAASLGFQYGGKRDVYEALGWKKDLTWQDYYSRYRRQDIATRIVNLPADATWREGFELRDDDDPDKETPFEAAWKELDKRIRLAAKMQLLDRIAGIGEYAVLYLGVRGQPPETPLRKTNAGALMYASVFKQPQAEITAFTTDLADERYGLPETYTLTVSDLLGGTVGGSTGGVVPGIPRGRAAGGRPVNVHWSRIIHAAEAIEDVPFVGRPRLEPVFNLLHVLEIVVGGAGEAFWRNARQRFHANIQPEYGAALDTPTLEKLGDEIAKMVHGYQDWVRTSGTDIKTLAPGIADPRGPVDVVLDLISAATGWPKRILLGSERGELASNQDAREFAHRIKERQLQYAEPMILRPTIDRLIEAGILPEPTDGEYEIEWPDLTGPSAEDRAKLADTLAAAEAKHAQAIMIGHPTLTDNEFREIAGFPAIDKIEQEFPGEDLGLIEPPEPEPQPGDDQQADEDQQDEDSDGGAEEDEEEEPAASARADKFISEIGEAEPAAGRFDPRQPRDRRGRWRDTGRSRGGGGGGGTGTGKKVPTKFVEIGDEGSIAEGFWRGQARKLNRLERIAPEAVKALKEYTGTAYASINNSLRSGTFDRGSNYYSTHATRWIDVALAQNTLGKDIIVYRAFSNRDLARDPKGQIGKFLQDKAFLSTSTRQSLALNRLFHPSRHVSAEIMVPKWLNALGVKSISDFAEEDEVLLPRGLKLRIVDAYKRSYGSGPGSAGDFTHVILEVVK